jgi:hypothetical protein
VACPMAKLMKAGTIVIDLVMKCGLRWDLNTVLTRHEKSTVSANPKVCPCRIYQGFGARDGLAIWQRLRACIEVIG